MNHIAIVFNYNPGFTPEQVAAIKVPARKR
jgi:hypothetical protein